MPCRSPQNTRGTSGRAGSSPRRGEGAPLLSKDVLLPVSCQREQPWTSAGVGAPRGAEAQPCAPPCPGLSSRPTLPAPHLRAAPFTRVRASHPAPPSQSGGCWPPPPGAPSSRNGARPAAPEGSSDLRTLSSILGPSRKPASPAPPAPRPCSLCKLVGAAAGPGSDARGPGSCPCPPWWCRGCVERPLCCPLCSQRLVWAPSPLLEPRAAPTCLQLGQGPEQGRPPAPLQASKVPDASPARRGREKLLAGARPGLRLLPASPTISVPSIFPAPTHWPFVGQWGPSGEEPALRGLAILGRSPPPLKPGPRPGEAPPLPPGVKPACRRRCSSLVGQSLICR